MSQVTITRRLRFNAAHRVYNPAFSDARNEELFGKCNNPNWHGHNYILDVSVSGEIDPDTGYVVDLSVIKDVVTKHVIDVVDHRNLNVDVPFLRGKIPTTENLAVAFWNVIEPVIRPHVLTRVRIYETENNFVDYHGAANGES